MTLTSRQASALLPTDEATGEATRDHFRAEFVRAYSEHEEHEKLEDWRAECVRAYSEHEKLGPATAEARQPIGAWLNHDDEFNEAVVLLRAYLRQRGYQIGGR